MEKIIVCSIILILVLTAFSAVCFTGHEITRWRDNHAAAVSLVFDDGYLSQFENAVPLLNRKKFKGIFFLITSESSAFRSMWRSHGL
jgi:peptidoglycan/xylan/chitin deacetylase (PgdA/CDA1 family)